MTTTIGRTSAPGRSVVSMMTRPRPAEELTGLVYGLTPKPHDADLPWFKRPAILALVVLAVTLLLNILFF